MVALRGSALKTLLAGFDTDKVSWAMILSLKQKICKIRNIAILI